MILRTLMAILLILFFARPMIDRGDLIGSRSSEVSTVVFLMDVSASMGVRAGGQDALVFSADTLQEVIRKIPAETRIGYISYSDRVEQELAPSLERSKLNSVLQNAVSVPRPTDVTLALNLATSMMSHQPPGRKTIVIVSDQAQHGYAQLLSGREPPESFDPNIRVILWEMVPEIPNTGIGRVELGLSGDGALKGQWAPSRSGPPIPGQGWSLTLNERVVATGTLDPRHVSGAEIPFQAQLPRGGFYAGALELTSDALPFDDTYYVAGRVPKGYRLLLIEGKSGLAPSDSEVYYVRLALESPRDPRVQSLSVIRPDALHDRDLEGTQAVIAANVGDLNSEQQASIQTWVENGGGLFLSAGTRWSAEGSALFHGFRFKGRQTGRWNLVKPEPGTELLSAIAGSGEFEWSQIEVTSYFVLRDESGLTPLIRLSNGDPILVRKEFGKGFVLAWLTSVDRSWTNFPAKPLYAPFVREMTAVLADPRREETSLNGWVGQPFRVSLPASVLSMTVVDPRGVSTAARVSDRGILEWPNPTVAGLYHVKTNRDEESFWFAINIPNMREEGNLMRVRLADLKPILPKAYVDWISSSQHGAAPILGALQGRDLTSAVILVLIFLFLLETLLSWPGRLWRWVRGPALALLVVVSPASWIHAGEGNNFVFGQLKHDGHWDPYPGVTGAVLEMVGAMTNIPFAPERRVVRVNDPQFFESPFLLVKGNAALNFTALEKTRIKRYVDNGGLIFFDDTLANSRSAFAQSVRALFSELYPDRPFQRLAQDHSIFRSFFLLRGAGGRRIAERYFEGMDVGGGLGGEARTAVIYCANDLLGAWVRDPLGRYTFVCEPGGEPQRWESFKLTLNIIYFSLTGTYKRDAVHQPFIERKLDP